MKKQETFKNGWVQLHRTINKHWIWTDANKLKWWIDILLTVNHADAKILIGNSVIECKRGQSINSLETWSKRWGVNKSKVRRFLFLLENDSMIVLESVRITTRLTVCNYDSYQGERNANETQMKRKRNASETQATPNNNVEEEMNNENNVNTKEIPAFEIFLSYALINKPKASKQDLELKYKAWVENGWKDGHDNQIKNWKSKVLSTLPFIKEVEPKGKLNFNSPVL
jgi:hypothetical protein